MAYCDNIDTGISLYCGNNPGGIQVAYIADFSKVASYTTSTQSVITAISMTASGVFYKYEFREDSSNFTQDNAPTLNSDVVTQVGTLVFQNLSTTRRNALNLLRGKKLIVVYKDFSGQYWLSGKQFGVRLTSRNQATGSARADDNIYTVVLTATELEDMFEVASAVIVAPTFPA